jgi:ribosomal protein S18 acetylase RimI-like enzyme
MQRTTLTDDQGPVVSFISGSREQRQLVDFTEIAPGRAIPDAIDALKAQSPGWFVSTPNGALAGELVAIGATQTRHAHGMLASTGIRDVVSRVPDAPDDVLPCGVLPFSGAPWTAILPSWKAAYPPGHPDHEIGDDQSLIETHLRPYVEQAALGPTHRSTGIAIVSPQITGQVAGQVLAGIIISLRPEPLPWGGPWVTEVWRNPAPQFRGVGSMLIRRALHLLHDDGYATLGLAVSHSNPARRVYEALGFIETSESWTLQLPGEVDQSET